MQILFDPPCMKCPDAAVRKRRSLGFWGDRILHQLHNPRPNRRGFFDYFKNLGGRPVAWAQRELSGILFVYLFAFLCGAL